MLTAAPVPLEFQDVASSAGLITPLLGMQQHSGAWGDANGDGQLDLFVGTFADGSDTLFNQRGNTSGASPNRLMINNGDGTFRESVQPAINIKGRTSGSAFADFDNDGRLDLIVTTNSSTTNAVTSQPNHIYRNDGNDPNGDPIYTDVTSGSNLDFPAPFKGRNPFVLDYDNDGKLDVFIQEDTWYGSNHSRLMHNDGNFIFHETTADAGLPTNLVGLGGAVGDINGDGYVDLFFAGARLFLSPTRYIFENAIFINNGDGTFRDGGAGAVLNVRGASDWPVISGDNVPAGGTLGDLNGDGRLDLVIGEHYQSTYKGLIRVGPRVYLNLGNDGNGNPLLQDITGASGVTQVYMKTPHVEIQDFDNDGRMDLLTSITMKVNGVFQPYILQNTGNNGQGIPQFQAPAGTDPATYNGYNASNADTPDPRYYAASPTADFDNDGKLDLFGEEWWPGHAAPLYQNMTASANHFLNVKIDLGAGTGNRYGIGATVQIYQSGQAGNAAALLGVKSLSISDGYVSGQAATVHFGLGDLTSADVVVKLPGGSTLTQSSASSNQTLTVTPGVAFQPLTWSSILTSTEYGAPPHLKAFDPATGQLLQSYFTFQAGFLGGIRVALGDVNGDGTPDAIVGAGPGAGPHVKVFNGATGQLLPGSIGSFWAFEQGFDNGLFVASADIDHDGKDDVIVGADGGAGPHVKVFSGASGAEIRSFFAFDQGFTGGVRVAGGDVNGDGRDDIIVGAGPGAGPHVKAFDGATGALLDSFWGFDPGFDSGIYVTAGEMNSDGKAEIVVSAGAGAGPHIRVFDGSGSSVLATFFAFDSSFGGGVRVASRDVNGDGRKDIVAMSGYGAAQVKVFDLTDFYNPPVLEDFIAFDGYGGGIFAG